MSLKRWRHEGASGSHAHRNVSGLPVAQMRVGVGEANTGPPLHLPGVRGSEGSDWQRIVDKGPRIILACQGRVRVTSKYRVIRSGFEQSQTSIGRVDPSRLLNNHIIARRYGCEDHRLRDITASCTHDSSYMSMITDVQLRSREEQ